MSDVIELNVGQPRSRVDGRAKVTGTATYSAEYRPAGMLYGYVVTSGIAKGRIRRMDTAQALSAPGVHAVFTHENRPRMAWFDYKWHDMVGPPGSPMRPLYGDTVIHSDQPIALVVAESFEEARHAAGLVRVEYDAAPHQTNLDLARGDAYVPPTKRSGIAPPPKSRGDAETALGNAPFTVRQEYRIPVEHHAAMEPHATTVQYDDGNLVVHDKVQGVGNTKQFVTNVFGLSSDQVRVVTPYVGGGFGSGLRPQYQVFLAVMAALELKRSVRVVLSRDQTFGITHRPETINVLGLGMGEDGKLLAIKHDAIAATSSFEDHQEVVVNWSGLLYDCPDASFSYKLVKLDTHTPGDMRAPGAPLGTFAVESAMDELAHETGIDPVELRLRNYAERDENDNKPFTSKELRACIRQGAEKFNWSRRTPAPRSMREGRELVGLGFATGAWESQMQKHTARALLNGDGTLEIACATADLGTGTYTILTQIAADALGLPMDRVTVKLGDTALPEAPVSGGSWTAASAGSAVDAACATLKQMLFKEARGLSGSPVANASFDRVVFRDGRIANGSDPSDGIALADVLAGAGRRTMEAEESAGPSLLTTMQYSSYTHAAAFVEVRVDEELGVVRVPRMLTAVAAGRILNPKTARSQIIGGMVFGYGMALREETYTDHNLGRFMNHNLAEYHLPVNADMGEMDVIFVHEDDDKASPIGVKGLGEIGIVALPAAIANAVFHATGRRIRDLPITVDKVLKGL